MQKLKEQAIEMIRDVPDDKMVYIIDILRGINGLFSEGNIDIENMPVSKTESTSEALEAWEIFKAYKGIIRYDIDEKAELAEARDEKYARFN